MTARVRAALVVQTSFLGDVVLTTPLIAELATHGPVDVVTTPTAAPLLAHHPAIRHVVIYDKRHTTPESRGWWDVAREIRANFASDRNRVAILAQGSWRSATLALVAGFRERVGFTTSAGRLLYTRRVPYQETQHHAERLWRLGAPVNALSPARDVLQLRLYPGARERFEVDCLFAQTGDRDAPLVDEPLVALAPGSVWATKRWPYFPQLAAALAAQAHVRIVLIGSAQDAALARAITAALPANQPPIDATGALSLLASADLIGRCRVLITNDSAPQHLASAMGTPTVSIFGPTVPSFGFGPLAPRHAIAGIDTLPCRPCDRHGPRRCPLGHWRCMRDLTVPDVHALIERVAFPDGD